MGNEERSRESSVATATRPSTPVRPPRERKPVRRGPISTARLAAALGAGKMVGATGRRLNVGGGTSLPGAVARRIDPQVLRKVMGATKARKVVICGSNGKTTTARMLAAVGRASGSRVTQNRSGSNLLQGVTSVAVNGANLL